MGAFPLVGDLEQVVHERMRFTGESYKTALAEIQAFGPLPAAEDRWQEWLEFYVVDLLGDVPPDLDSVPSEMTALSEWAPDWPPGTVLGIRSVTPRPHELLLTIDPAALAGVLAGLLPWIEDEGTSDEVTGGAPGLRPRYTSRGLELYWPGSNAMLLVEAVTSEDWQETEARILRSYDSNEVRPLWLANPAAWTQAEQRSVLAGRPGFPDAAWIDSGILRRAGLFRDLSASALIGGNLLGSDHHADGTPEHGPRDTLIVETDRRASHTRTIEVPIDYGHRTTPSPWPIRRHHSILTDSALATGRPWDHANRS